MKTARRVLVLTGGLISEKDTSFLAAAQKQRLQWRHSREAWLDLKVKLVAAEPIALGRLHRSLRGRRPGWAQAVDEFFEAADNLTTPELTEVVLATLLAREGVPYELATYAEIFAGGRRTEALLGRCDLVFASTTLLRDLSEVKAVVGRIKTATNRIVLGGPLASLLAAAWEGMPEVDGLAVGYGEFLVPALAEYWRTGFKRLKAPSRGRLDRGKATWYMYSGVPEDKSLDALPTPDWARSVRDRRRTYRMVYYESVRGCPYRCNFCNYPYLFDDSVFRYKSANRIADDWERYRQELGIRYITCLDSLFTMPHKRLVDLCDQIVRRRIDVKWICYARADDLAHPGVPEMMKAAGAHQVQIGIESGVQEMLDGMNKRCTVDANARALANCRRIGLTTVVSLIVGFPGETEDTLDRTLEFLRATPPDFFFLATFSTRVAGVPVLSPANRARFGLSVSDNLLSTAPYWKHHTMSCAHVGNHVRALALRLMEECVSLNAALFYPGLLNFRPELRDSLLTFQREAVQRYPLLRRLFDLANTFVDRRLLADVERTLGPAPRIVPLVRRA